MTMKREKYLKPACAVVLLDRDLMDGDGTLPGFGSGTTDSGDDSGGGLAKKRFIDPDADDNTDMKNFNVWGDD
jgi:hypothetical protein